MTLTFKQNNAVIDMDWDILPQKGMIIDIVYNYAQISGTVSQIRLEKKGDRKEIVIIVE